MTSERVRFLAALKRLSTLDCYSGDEFETAWREFEISLKAVQVAASGERRNGE